MPLQCCLLLTLCDKKRTAAWNRSCHACTCLHVRVQCQQSSAVTIGSSHIRPCKWQVLTASRGRERAACFKSLSLHGHMWLLLMVTALFVHNYADMYKQAMQDVQPYHVYKTVIQMQMQNAGGNATMPPRCEVRIASDHPPAPRASWGTALKAEKEWLCTAATPQIAELTKLLNVKK